MVHTMTTNKKIVAAALKTAGHYIDVEANVLYITPVFNKKSQIYGTAECSRMNAILAAFPSMTVKVQSKDRKNNAVTYAMMEDFIRIMPDAATNYAEYRTGRKRWRLLPGQGIPGGRRGHAAPEKHGQGVLL